ncbi:MAG: LLM class flavin-dependent oxidoreductase [Acidimicrobiia bacterium]|nr:MAG: LLM class flavin-dependent oxidoreductase [Acidimicrobiia bacterium]
MPRMGLGFVSMTMEVPQLGRAPSWGELRSAALLAEDVGFDTVWVADELLWESDEWDEPRGWWECAALCGALAEATNTIGIGSWVFSALHRNPGLTAKMVETLDEISGGRFTFGYGSGHAARQGEAFGFPSDKTVGRYVEALDVVVPLLRKGSVDVDGEYHSARNQENRPRGPRPGKIPLMLGGHGPRTMRLAVQHADIWSGYATDSNEPEAFVPMLKQLEEICESEGRDPATIERSIGLFMQPPGTEVDTSWGMEPVNGIADDIVRTIEQFAEIGCTRLELMVLGDPAVAIEQLAPVVERTASL